MLRRNPQRPRPKRSRPIRLEQLEQRQLLAATPLGVTPKDTGEFFLGKVAVTPVLLESNGFRDPETQDWTDAEIDAVLANVRDGVGWWTQMLDKLDTVHTLEFVIDESYARSPVPTAYEPIERTSADFNLWVDGFVNMEGYGGFVSVEDAVQAFNHDQRAKHGTDWAFTIFVVDASDDADGLFPAGLRGAFAFAGGLFIVTPSSRPASTYAHEIGHMFWARDEYSGSQDEQRGYYNAYNLNAPNPNDPSFQQEISIMRGNAALRSAYENVESPESTLAQVGWRDSDGDGVFDLADVPLSLDAVGYFDAEASLFHLRGTASAVALLNQNSEGPQSDITLNRISELQYRLDGGDWTMAADPDQQVFDFSESVSINGPFSTIQWRVIDLNTGITSPIIEATPTQPALPQSSIAGIAFLDDNANGQRNLDETALGTTQVTIRQADGSPLFGGRADAADLTRNFAGVTLSTDGELSDGEVDAFVSEDAGQRPVFHWYDRFRFKWKDRWSSDAKFEATFDQTVGQVTINAAALGDTSFARLEAYDSSGQLIQRATSEAIAADETTSVTVSDPQGRIARVKAFGHAETSVALLGLTFGFEDTMVTDAGGGFHFQNLSDGNYLVELTPEYTIHQFAAEPIAIEVSAGASSFLAAAAARVNSPRHNEAMPEDTDQSGVVTSRDALLVINDLAASLPRVLSPLETEGFEIDVNNDGAVSAVDALMVINYLSRQASGGAESESLGALGTQGDFGETGLPAPTYRLAEEKTASDAGSAETLDIDAYATDEHFADGPVLDDAGGALLAKTPQKTVDDVLRGGIDWMTPEPEQSTESLQCELVLELIPEDLMEPLG